MPEQYSHHKIDFLYPKDLPDLPIPRSRLLKLGQTGLLFMQVEFPGKDHAGSEPIKIAANMHGVTSSYRYHLGYTTGALEGLEKSSSITSATSSLIEYAELHTVSMADAINRFYDGIFNEAKSQISEDNSRPFLHLEQAQRAMGLSYRKILEYRDLEPAVQPKGGTFKGARPTWDLERLAAVYLWNVPGSIEVREAVHDGLNDTALQHAVMLNTEQTAI